jgi:signal transduction histidine kinase
VQVPLDLAEMHDAINAIVGDGRRASEIIQRLRGLARKTRPEKVALNINDVINELIPLVHREMLSHRVSLRLELAPMLPLVKGDRVQLQQVIINLAVNAMEAMAPVTDRPRELIIRSQQGDSGQVLIAVKDTGMGIDPEDMNQLFKAFFTTKPSGMGMGLSICRTIVENHGGTLTALPNAGPGATLQFTLQSFQEAKS